MHHTSFTRRAAILGAAASTVAVAATAVPAVAQHDGDVCALPVDMETDGLSGLPLAAVHIERAIAAMADIHFGKWAVTIRSGEPDQHWAFHQIGAGCPTVDRPLFKLIEEYRAAEAAAEAAWDIARPLQQAALAEMDRRGLNVDRHWDIFSAIHRELGAEAVEEIADAAAEREIQLLARVREARPLTLRGLAAKFDVLRSQMQIDDDTPRIDQDLNVEFFNVFGDDLLAIASA